MDMHYVAPDDSDEDYPGPPDPEPDPPDPDELVRELGEHARNGTLDQVLPRGGVTEDLLCRPFNFIPGINGLGERDSPDSWSSVIGLAALHGSLHQILPDFLVRNAKHAFSDMIDGVVREGTILHIAAQRGHLRQFPSEALSIENLFELFDSSGRNVAMVAGEAGFITHIPRPLLTRTTLSARNHRGETTFHCLAGSGQIKTLPERLIEYESFMIPDWQGNTPLYWALISSKPDDIPPAFYSKESLTHLNTFGRQFLDYVFEKGSLHRIPKNIRFACRQCRLEDGKRLKTVLKEAGLWLSSEEIRSFFAEEKRIRYEEQIRREIEDEEYVKEWCSEITYDRPVGSRIEPPRDEFGI